MLQKTGDAGKRQPENPLTGFFDGHAVGEGLVIDRFGKIRNRLRVGMHGYWQEGGFILDEDFAYGDGTREKRRWTVRFGEDGSFVASAPDLGQPATGRILPGEVRMKYLFDVTIGGRRMRMRFDDRMYSLDGETLYQRARMSRFGIALADVVLVFRKTA